MLDNKLDKLKREMLANLDLNEVDWGFCIPDCGRCCLGAGKEITPEEADYFASRLQLPKEDFLDSEKRAGARKLILKTCEDRCVFLCQHSLCLVNEYKPKVCRRYGHWLSDCKDFRRIKVLMERGRDVRQKLKELWLIEIKKNGYDKVKWKVNAEMFVEKMGRKQTE